MNKISNIAIIIFFIAAIIFSYFQIGILPIIIFTGASIPTIFLWYKTYYRQPTDPALILPAFLVTSAGFEINLIEDYLGNFGPALSRVFNIGWTNHSFIITALTVTVILTLVSLGLFLRNKIAGLIACYILISRLAQFAVFIFPLIRPQIEPELINSISQTVSSGIMVTDMPNYYYQTTEGYYFPGMYTVALTILPAMYTIYRLWKFRLKAIHN
jgi:hypothetical protein